MAHVRQSRPDSGLGFQVKVLEAFQGVPSSLKSGLKTNDPKHETLSRLLASGGKQVYLAEGFVGLATDTILHLSRRGEALKVNELTFTIRASDSSWHPGLPGRPLSPGGRMPEPATGLRQRTGVWGRTRPAAVRQNEVCAESRPHRAYTGVPCS